MRISSIKLRFFLLICPILILGFGVVLGVESSSMTRIVSSFIDETAVSSAWREGNLVEKDIASAETAALALASSLSVCASHGAPCSEAIAFLSAYKSVCPRALAAWAIFKPGMYPESAFAPADRRYRSPDGHFSPIVSDLGGNHKVAFREQPDPDSWAEASVAEAYRSAEGTGKLRCSDPSVLTIDGNAVFGVTICAPIVSDGLVLGAVGLDISLDALNALVSGIKPYGSGYAFLASHDGTIIAHRSTSLAGKKNVERIDDLAGTLDLGKPSITTRPSVLDTKPCRVVLVPVPVSEGDSYWIFGLALPLEALTAPLENLKFLAIAIAVVGIAAMCLALFFALSSVSRPLKATAAGFRDLAEGEGDLRRRMEGKYQDEIGDLVRDFNSFIGKLQEIVSSLKAVESDLEGMGDELGASVDDTAGSVSQIASSVDKVRGRVERQVDSVSESSSAVEQIARNIDSLEALIGEQAASVTQASASIEEMVGNIGSVTSTTEVMAERFSELLRLSSAGRTKQEEARMKIAAIAEQSLALLEANEAISAVAEQTNLLAMNAAIEAAHAGEAGKGFSVVADEIRMLSENASEQSRNIGAQLEGIREAIDLVVASSTESGNSYEMVASHIADVERLVSELKQAMIEEKEGSAQVLEALKSMNGVTSRVRTSSEEMGAGADTILGEMGRLKEASAEIKGSMDEMSSGARAIESNTRKVAVVASSTRDTIEKMKDAIGRFKV